MARLINIGSLCIDYVYTVSHIASVGETVASEQVAVFPGGKGLNQSIAAAKAGAEVDHFGAIGADGAELVEFMAAAGVGVDGIVNLPGHTGHAVIQIDHEGQNSIVIAGGTNREIPQKIIHGAITGAKKGDWVLLQNETNDVGNIIELGSRAGCKVAVNLAPADHNAQSYNYAHVHLLIVNELEAKAVSGCSSVSAAFDNLVATYPEMNLVLTMGGDGLRYYQVEGPLQGALGAYAVSVVDETAAGDTFVGYLMAGLVQGASMADVLIVASAAGALATTRPGAAPAIPESDEVHALMAEQNLPR